MKNAIYTLLIMLLAVVNLQAQNNHVVKVPEPDGEVVVGAIGGTVDVSALGGATYTIPIQVPEGLGGIQPNLSITYNSQSGNGLLGWGWNLGGMSAITRVGRTLYHDDEVCGVNFDYRDRYALDGQRLMLINGAYGGNGAEYKTEVDGMSRIVSHTEGRYADGPAYFTVYTPEGLTLYYGWDKSGDDNARIIWEKDGVKKVVLWLLKRVEDQNGNYMVYNYNVGQNHGINQHSYCLDNIQYCANPAASNESGNNRGTKYGVDFIYKKRTDKENSFIGKYSVQQPWLLDCIKIYHWSDPQHPMYRYVFSYKDKNHIADNPELYFHSLLETIKFDCNGLYFKETVIRHKDYPYINNFAKDNEDYSDMYYYYLSRTQSNSLNSV